ncbi:hypothetical protein VB834_02965 [Limnoraphis robusta Tam1]|uniref:Uncharacterized protein n=1 Tax=Limnoraphis robusta CCNP1315 TaxID=3110306 RepID=A0ABU5TW47_9CYAN|nr:hypothetical protein [Limnoraphis robusta]MEA5519034.1 hypothetical protein [Limnoraphis robusta CCNP1315]MEA5537986.1 hypothetical protein [Limnoraphis robusta Tam1]MEA5544116.1 hypothetical protein [Limnoraphis robusta CCNP1324]
MADLSGTWLGTYWQQGDPTRFEVTFIQSGNTLSGNILDDGYLGEARLSGTVTGRNVSFTKRYLMTSPESVSYMGIVSEEENYIQGQWNIDSRFSGPWEAHRSGENLVAELETLKSEQVPAAVSLG